MPRLGYKKTRTGCLKCRQRKIKCDEQQPCGACRKHNVPCSLIISASHPAHGGGSLDGSVALSIAQGGPESASQPLPSAASSHGDFSFSDNLNEVGTGPRQTRHSSRFVNGSPRNDHDPWVADLELIHHYTSRAYLTMPRADHIGHIWRDIAFDAGLSHRFLLHHILAFSALHLAYLEPSRRRQYFLLAAEHQNRGSELMRDALGNINAENCHALFAAASLLMLCSLGDLAVRVSEAESDWPSPKHVMDVFSHLRGMIAVLHLWEGTIQQGPFSDLFRATYATKPSLFGEAMAQRLTELRTEITSRSMDHTISDVLETEILQLLHCVEAAMKTTPVPELRAIMVWPSRISEAYIQLLRGESPGALVIFVHYCALVHETESTCWFTRGWSLGLMETVKKQLPPAWQPLVDWPLERSRGNPL